MQVVGAAFCLFCLSESDCPPDAPYRSDRPPGIVCATRKIAPEQVPEAVDTWLERRCAATSSTASGGAGGTASKSSGGGA